MTKPIQSIVIVGGGTAGWITAGIIAAKLKADNVTGSVTLIESPNIPTVGVGEGTWPTMRRTLKTIGVRETDFIRECHVSFKQGAKFAKWVNGTEDDFYFHPLVLPQDFDNINLASHWQHNNAAQSFSNMVCPQEAICEQGLAPKMITTAEYAAEANYAYHLDAGCFSTFLQKHCVSQLNVKHILADVTKINNAENGDIASVTTADKKEIIGDLFIDCSGFKSLLLGEHLQVPFISCKDVLFIDNALAVHVPYQDENSPIASHTISTAQSAGWIWDIGLSTRRGVGHVYSSKYTTEEKAIAELKAYLKPTVKNVDDLTFRKIPIEPGHREKFWHKNCVAIGLSAGFLEPLEASALLLVEISAQMIADQLPASRAAMDVVAKRFNTTFRYRWDRIIDFLKLHYMLSKRTDTPFWVDNRDANTIPESLQELLTLWQYQPPWHNDFDHLAEVFPAASYQYVLYGMGFKTQANHLGISSKKAKEAALNFEKNTMQTQQFLAKLPTNRELLKKNPSLWLTKSLRK